MCETPTEMREGGNQMLEASGLGVGRVSVSVCRKIDM